MPDFVSRSATLPNHGNTVSVCQKTFELRINFDFFYRLRKILNQSSEKSYQNPEQFQPAEFP
jgi:hypothetical protein